MEEKTDVPKPPDYLKDAIVFLDTNQGWMMCATYHSHGKWLFKLHADGKEWYSIRAATPEDLKRLAVAETQVEEKTDVPTTKCAIRPAHHASNCSWNLMDGECSCGLIPKESQAPPAKLETGVMYDATVNGEEGQVMFFSKEAAEAYSRPSLSLAADGLAEALRWLDRRGGLGYDAHEEIQKRVATYEKAKESR